MRIAHHAFSFDELEVIEVVHDALVVGCIQLDPCDSPETQFRAAIRILLRCGAVVCDDCDGDLRQSHERLRLDSFRFVGVEAVQPRPVHQRPYLRQGFRVLFLVG